MIMVIVFFVSMIILSPLVALSTSSWVIFWASMELGMLSLVPVLFKNFLSVSEAAIKYFLIQTLASILMFFSGMMIFSVQSKSFFALFFLLVSLAMKLGIFPLHFWVIPVVEYLSFTQIMILLIPMKIPSLALLDFSFNASKEIMVLMAFFSMVAGAILGNNCSSVRSMLGASSIVHSGWFILGLLSGFLWFYFWMYSLSLLLTLSVMDKDSLSSSLMILSLAGLPPFLLFSGKFMVLFFLVYAGYSIFVMLIPILSAVFSLNFYMKMSYFFFFNTKKNFVFLPLFFLINFFAGLSVLIMV